MGSTPHSFRSSRPRRISIVKQIKPPTWANSPQVRALLVWGVLVASTGLLAVNLFHVQVIRSPGLQDLAKSQQQTQLSPFIPRRTIVDRLGNVLALDRPVYTLYAHPKLFKSPQAEIAEKLAPILERSTTDLVKKFAERETGIQIEYSLVEDVANRISDLQIDGLELLQHQQRLYPHKNLAADIVGYVDAEQHGQAGLELSQQNILERPKQVVQLKRMGDGSVMPDQVPTGFLNQDDLQLRLTIDTRLQRAVQPILAKQVGAVGAKRGAVIVMEAKTGELLAMVSEPSYDPNQYYKADPERFKNWMIADLYEPGSTFKPINVAIALDSKVIKPDTVISNPSSIAIGEWTIHGGSGGSDPVTDIVINSSNVGMVNMMDLLKPEVYYRSLRRLGLGGTVGIDLPAEMPGQFKARKTFMEAQIERAVTAFGQGFSLTPLKLVQLHAALANGGKLITPHVVQGLFDSKGQLYWKPSLPASRQVFSPESTKAIIPMMEGVVEQGTGKAAQVPGYRIAGKTGTSQKANGFGGYSESAYVTSFVGIVPAENPRFVVLAVIDEPAGGGYGGVVAAPVVKQVIQSLVNLHGIPPSVPVKPAEPAESETQDHGDE